MKAKIISLLGILQVCSCSAKLVDYELLVKGESGEAVKGAKAIVSFINAKDIQVIHTQSDLKGRVEVKGWADLRTGVGLTSPGYYESYREFGLKTEQASMILRPIQKPVPMYAKKVWIAIPSKSQKYGFDLEKADWVAPYGKGQTAHVDFRVDGERQDMFNYDEKLQVRFANPDDGLIKLGADELQARHDSAFRFPYLAPDSGYIESLSHHSANKFIKEGYSKRHEGTQSYDRAMLGYIFRVNTELDSEGEVVSANYGKILGEIKGAVWSEKSEKGEGVVVFTYYYNPVPNERSLEFDVKQNLHGKLPYLEDVDLP